jgi:hypothetical protein
VRAARAEIFGQGIFGGMPIALITRDKYGRYGLARRVDGLPIRCFSGGGEGRGSAAAKTEQRRAEK